MLDWVNSVDTRFQSAESSANINVDFFHDMPPIEDGSTSRATVLGIPSNKSKFSSNVSVPKGALRSRLLHFVWAQQLLGSTSASRAARIVEEGFTLDFEDGDPGVEVPGTGTFDPSNFVKPDSEYGVWVTNQLRIMLHFVNSAQPTRGWLLPVQTQPSFRTRFS